MMEREWHAWFADAPKRAGQRPRVTAEYDDDRPMTANKPGPAPSQVVHSVSMTAERKRLRASLRANHLGQFVAITEEVGHRRTTIVVPASAMEEFVRMLAEVAAQVGREAGSASSTAKPIHGCEP